MGEAFIVSCRSQKHKLTKIKIMKTIKTYMIISDEDDNYPDSFENVSVLGSYKSDRYVFYDIPKFHDIPKKGVQGHSFLSPKVVETGIHYTDLQEAEKKFESIQDEGTVRWGDKHNHLKIVKGTYEIFPSNNHKINLDFEESLSNRGYELNHQFFGDDPKLVLGTKNSYTPCYTIVDDKTERYFSFFSFSKPVLKEDLKGAYFFKEADKAQKLINDILLEFEEFSEPPAFRVKKLKYDVVFDEGGCLNRLVQKNKESLFAYDFYMKHV